MDLALRSLVIAASTVVSLAAASTPTVVSATPSFANGAVSFAVVGSGFNDGVVTHHAGASLFGAHEYLAIATPATWPGAKSDCEARGGYLVTVTSDAERDFIHDLTTQDYWIGMSDFALAGDWRWVTGEPVVYTRWAPSEPNNPGQEHAVQMYRDWGQWNNLSDSVALPYVCEFSTPPTVTLRRAGQPDVPSVRTDLASASSLTAWFAAQPLPAGTYDVVVTNGDGGSATLAGGFVMPQVAPIANDAGLVVAPGGTLSFSLPGFDPNGDPLTYAIDAGPAVGTLTLFDTATGACTYTAPGGVGSVTIAYHVSDGIAASGVGTVTIAWGLQPLPGGPLTQLLHLGADENDGSSAVMPSGGALMWDHFIFAGLGPEELQQPTPGLAEDMGLAMTTSPLVWTALADADGTWAGGMPAQTVGYYGIYLFSATTRSMRIEIGGNSADRVWLDGARDPIVDGGGGTISAPFTLGAGLHVLMIKDYTGPGPSGAMLLRLRDEAGADITGLQFALQDVIHPTMVSKWPAAGASGVSRLADIQITFSEPMDTGVDPATVATLGGGASDGVWSWGDRFRLCWTPHSPLDPGTTYQVELHRAQARDPAGNVLAGGTAFSFTTETAAIAGAPAPATIAPTAVHRGVVIPLELDGAGFAIGPIAHPPGVTEFGGHFYRFYPERTWVEAEAELEALGGHLATISSAAEDDFVWRLGGRINGLIGMRDPTQTLEQWVWVTGEPLAGGYTNWAPGEPNSFGGETEDVGIYWWGLQWNDVGDGARTYVGEFDRPRAPSVVLKRAGAVDRPAHVLAATANRLDLSWDARGAATGAWDVVIANPGGESSTMAGAVTVLNDAPVASDLSLHALPGVPRHAAFAASDANGDLLTYAALSSPTKGTLTVDAATGAFTYTADAGASGSDSFTYAASDGEATSAPATVTISFSEGRPLFAIYSPTTAAVFHTVNGNAWGSGTVAFAGVCPDGAVVTWSASGASTASGSATVTPAVGSGGRSDWSFTAAMPAGTTVVSITAAVPGSLPESAAVTIVRGSGPLITRSVWPYVQTSDGLYATTGPGTVAYGNTSGGLDPTSAWWTAVGATTDGGTFSPPTSGSVNFSALAAGITTVTLGPTRDGGVDEVVQAVLKDLDPPDVTVTVPSLVVALGETVALSGSVYDVSDRVVRIGFSDAPGGSPWSWNDVLGAAGDEWHGQWAFTTLGAHTIYVHALDRAGNLGEASITITVVAGSTTSGTTTGGTTTGGTTTSGTTTGGTTTGGTTTSGTTTSGTTTSGTTTSGVSTSGTTTSGTTASGTATSGTSTSGTTTSGSTTSGTASGSSGSSSGSGSSTPAPGDPVGSSTPETGGGCGLGGGVAVLLGLMLTRIRRRSA